MSRKPNKTKAEYIDSLRDKVDILNASAKNIVFNFKFFVASKSSGQSFEDWQRDEILADLNNKLKIFSGKTVRELQQDGTLEVYGGYPSDSRFTCPPSLTGIDVEWCRLRITGRRRLIGFFSTAEGQKTFYMVFLDKNHEFAPSSKD